MKQLRIWSLCILLFVAFPITAGAHVALKSSSPADGETITSELNSIELTFSGEILPMSKLVITDETGVETAPLEMNAAQGTLTAKLAAPLPNGTYDVNWNIVAEDGHSLEGGIQFTVAVELEEEQRQAEEPITDEPAIEAPANEKPTIEEPGKETAADQPEPAAPPEQEEQGQLRNYVPLIAAAGALILVVFIFLLIRPKRKP